MLYVWRLDVGVWIAVVRFGEYGVGRYGAHLRVVTGGDLGYVGVGDATLPHAGTTFRWSDESYIRIGAADTIDRFHTCVVAVVVGQQHPVRS